MTTAPQRRELSDRLRSSRIIAVLRAPSVAQLYPACDVLVEQGVLSLEFTLTTPGLLKALPTLVDRYGSTADVGVGTVTTAAQADEAIDYDVDYLVTPTVNEPVVTLAVRRGVAVFPGGLTPSELAAGWDAGATAVKVFPAQTVGAGYVTHLRGPFPDMLVVPSGGVDRENAGAWLDAGAVAVSMGSPLLGDALHGGDLNELRRRCRWVVALAGSRP